MDLATLLTQPEGKTLEFKRDLSSPAGVLRTVVAFANSAGGTVLIGVEDGTRQVRGVPDPLGMEERLANLLSDGISPRLLPDIEVLPWRKQHVVALRVYPSPNRPHHLVAAGAQAGVYLRLGSTNRRADGDAIAELRRSNQTQAFDEQGMPELGPDAVDFSAATACFAAVRKLRRADLQALRLLVPHQGRVVPSHGGVLLFGRDRTVHFPDAWLQAGRFVGSTRSTLLDAVALRGTLPNIVETAIEFVQKHGLRGFEIGAVRRANTFSLPPVALREAVINAVVHADYAQRGAPLRLAIFNDRVEIENPGLLAPGLTVEDLQRGTSKLRNRVIGRVFQELGLIENWGTGVQRMVHACQQAGLPAPLFEEIGTRFRVTLGTTRGLPARAAELDTIDTAIMKMLAARTGKTTQQIALHIGRTPRATRTRLARLVDRGWVREIGSSPSDPQRRYFRATPA